MNLFINPYERRLRAGWRLVLQTLLLMILGLLISIAISVAGFFVSLFSEGLTPNLGDQVIALMESWLFQPVMGLGTVLAVLGSMWAASRWLDRRPLHAFGLRFNSAWWRDFIFGLCLGAFLMLCIFLTELGLGWITVVATFYSADSQVPFSAGMLGYAVFFLCVGVYEELLSRGYHLRNLAEGFSFRLFETRWALLLAYIGSSALFGLGHASNPNATWVSTMHLMAAGLFLGLGLMLTGELAIPIGLHISWNFFQGNVFGFPVSGLTIGTSLIAIEQGGPDLATGGAFGPEAGLIGLVAIALGSLLTVGWVRWNRGKAQLQIHLAQYTPPAIGEKITTDQGAAIRPG